MFHHLGHNIVNISDISIWSKFSFFSAMLLLSHNGETHAPSVTMLPSSPSSSSSATTYFRLKGYALKWIAKYNMVPKAESENKRFEEALQLCSC
ncbi:hypothetical protein VNO78_11617 [Psophocarpus tetragonolobus]|uniref:Uncharacterized protein n=1 Tax=Psophocarpus tetragonolobus TaxID=3891 RepID=A0AAN9SMQ9_PSOTE